MLENSVQDIQYVHEKEKNFCSLINLHKSIQNDLFTDSSSLQNNLGIICVFIAHAKMKMILVY